MNWNRALSQESYCLYMIYQKVPMVLSIGPLLFRVVVFFLSDKGKASSRVGFRTSSVAYGEPLFKPVLPPVYKKFCQFMYTQKVMEIFYSFNVYTLTITLWNAFLLLFHNFLIVQKSRGFLVRQLWMVNYYINCSSNISW